MPNPNYPKYCPPDSKYFKYIEEQKTFLAGKKIKELNQRINRRQLTLDNLIAAVELSAIFLLPEKIKESSADEIIKILSIVLKLEWRVYRPHRPSPPPRPTIQCQPKQN